MVTTLVEAGASFQEELDCFNLLIGGTDHERSVSRKVHRPSLNVHFRLRVKEERQQPALGWGKRENEFLSHPLVGSSGRSEKGGRKVLDVATTAGLEPLFFAFGIRVEGINHFLPEKIKTNRNKGKVQTFSWRRTVNKENQAAASQFRVGHIIGNLLLLLVARFLLLLFALFAHDGLEGIRK